jgi:hypothetical protein
MHQKNHIKSFKNTSEYSVSSFLMRLGSVRFERKILEFLKLALFLLIYFKKLNFFFKTLDIKSDQSPNDILNIPKLKAKHKRLFKKLVSLKAKNQINEFKGI